MTGKRTFGKNTRNFVNDEYTLVNHPPGNETGVSLVRVYVCGFEFSYLFSYFLLARELFGKTPSPAREARPETLVKVSARSVPSGARGRCSFFFSPGWSGSDDFLGSRGRCLPPTYLHPPAKSRHSFLPFHERTSAQTCITSSTTTDGRQRTQRYNAAAHKHQQTTPCVCDSPICAVRLRLRVFVGVRGPTYYLYLLLLRSWQTHAHFGRKC